MTSPSILVLRFSSLGDLILTTSLLTALRECYPDSHIDLVTSVEYASLGPLIPAVTQIDYFDRTQGFRALLGFRNVLKRRRYDVVLDLHNSLRTRILRQALAKQVHVVDKRTIKRWMLVRYKYDQLRTAPDVIGRYFEAARDLGIQDDGRTPQLVLSAAPTPMKDHATRTIGMAPGAKHWSKRWPSEYYTELAERLLSKGYHIALFGSLSESALCEALQQAVGQHGTVTNYAGRLSLAETAEQIASMTAMITNDSGLMHMSNAVGTPTLSFFGPTVREFGFAPRSPSAIVLELEGLYCRPCTAIGLERCPEKHFRCMRELTPELAIVQIEKMVM